MARPALCARKSIRAVRTHRNRKTSMELRSLNGLNVEGLPPMARSVATTSIRVSSALDSSECAPQNDRGQGALLRMPGGSARQNDRGEGAPQNDSLLMSFRTPRVIPNPPPFVIPNAPSVIPNAPSVIPNAPHLSFRMPPICHSECPPFVIPNAPLSFRMPLCHSECPSVIPNHSEESKVLPLMASPLLRRAFV